VVERKCRYCGRGFVADRRVGDRQKACSVPCQKLRKQENNRLYKEKNPDYWKNHYEDHVKPWRQKHPDYQRQWRQKRKIQLKATPGEIQAEMIVNPSLRASLRFQFP
jgi:hypothetical protein